MKILCKILGHKIRHIDIPNRSAYCQRCGKNYHISYDMMYGDTIVENIIVENRITKSRDKENS